MFKSVLVVAITVVALLATMASIGSASAKPPPLVQTYSGRLIGPVGSGYFEYTEWAATGPEMRQRLQLVVRDYEPFARLGVAIDGRRVGYVMTDKEGYVDYTFWNPPLVMPQVRPGSVITVGGLVAKVSGS